MMFRLTIVTVLIGLSVGEIFKGDADGKVARQMVKQIMTELRASYFYQAYSHYFERSSVALPGFAKFFEKASIEERTHATGLIEYMNKRGVDVNLQDLNYKSLCTEVGKSLDTRDACICLEMAYTPEGQSSSATGCSDLGKKSGLYAMEDTLALEIAVNEMLLELHGLTSDIHLGHLLEHQYLDEQVEAIKQIGDYVTQLKRVGDAGLGEYLFDKQLQD